MVKLKKFSAELPEFYIIRGKNWMMYVLGVEHTSDIDHPEIERIEKLLKQFLLEKDISDRIVLVEGGNWPVESNKREAIKNYGEMAYVVYLSNINHLPVYSPEIDEIDEIKILLRTFSQDEIIDFYFTRGIPQWQRSDRSQNLEEFLDMQQYSKITSWVDYDFSLRHLIEIHNKQNNHTFNQESCGQCLMDKNSINYRVNSASIKIRDNFIYKKIKELRKDNESIFLVYGRLHTSNLKRRLNKLS